MMKSLKTMLCLMAMAVVTPVCSQEKDNNPWPWDFPQSVKLKLEVGQTVLSPYTYYPSSVEKGEPLRQSVLIFYDTTVKEVGGEKTTLDKYNGVQEMPNALIIPLPKKAKAKKLASVNASKKAIAYAEEKGVDITQIKKDGIIKTQDVDKWIENNR